MTFEEYKKQRLEEGKTRSEIQRGFRGELIPTAGMIGGGIAGGLLFGGPPGAIAGAAIGGGLGETMQQKLEQLKGQRKKLNAAQIAATGLTSGALEAATAGIGIVAKPAIKAIRVPLVKTISKLSGWSSEIVEKAMERGPGILKVLKGGEKDLTEIIKSSAIKFHKFAGEQLIKSKEMIKKLEIDKFPGISKKIKDLAIKLPFSQFSKNFISYSPKGEFRFAEEESIKKAGFKNIYDFF